MVKRIAVVAVAASALLLGCSGGGGAQPTPAVSISVVPDSAVTNSTAGDATTAGRSLPTPPTETSGVTPSAPASDPDVTVPTEASLPEVQATGVPGLDSEDAFCAAWSRFGGSWQVFAVGSGFLDDPDLVATWEIAASAVIGPAYDELVGTFPPELASEADVAADGFFGALQRRSADAARSLADAGATDDMVQLLGDAWIDALARRDPFDPDLAFEVPEGLQAVVEAAAADFRTRRVEFHLDPSMAIAVATPLTDTYLDTVCPGQGTITGQEIDDG